MSNTVCVVGDGAWGTAFATLLADNNYNVNLWCYDKDVAESIQKSRTNNKYLPGVKLNSKIKAVTDFKEAFEDVKFIFEAVPVKFLRSVLQDAKDFISEDQVWIALSKGIEKDTLLFSTQIIKEVFDNKIKIAAIAGPSYAQDLVDKQITGVDLAYEDEKVAKEIQQIVNNSYFKTNLTTDIIGIQICGAVKNIIAIVIGMAEGKGYTDNTKCLLLTLGLTDISTLIKSMNANEKTVYGLSGVGDIVLTAMGSLSKNLKLGKKLGSGESLQKITDESGVLPEGINSMQSIHQLSKKLSIKLPICNGIYEVIFKNKSFDDFLSDVFN